MTPLIKHNFSEEVIIPLAALSYNLDVLSGRENKVATLDGVECVVTKIDEIHALSEDAIGIIKRLYNIDLMTYLMIWNKKLSISSLWLAHVKLKKAIYVETKELPRGDYKGDTEQDD